MFNVASAIPLNLAVAARRLRSCSGLSGRAPTRSVDNTAAADDECGQEIVDRVARRLAALLEGVVCYPLGKPCDGRAPQAVVTGR